MRRSFYLTTICGTALALSAPAIAQNARPTDNENRVRTAQPRNATNTDAESVLRRLEGLWSVELRVNEALWNMTTRDRSAWSDRQGDSHRDGVTDRERVVNPEGDDLNRQPVHAHDRAEPRTMTGVAETSLIMDGKILRERAFINNNLNSSSSAPDPDRRSGAVRIDPSSSMSTLSFISFDEPSGTYSAVFMSSKDGMMHFDQGRFDASSNRIVFEGRRDSQDGVYRGPRGANPSGRIDGEFIEDSYPNKSATPGSGDRDHDDRTDRDGVDHDRPSDPNTTDRNTTDRNTPTPIDRDRTTTDRPVTDRDRSTTERANQPEGVRPASQDEKDEKPYWENNTPDGRRPGTAQPDATRPNDRSSRNADSAYVVVPSNSENVRVVLELLGSDQYRVTMYQGPSIDWSTDAANPNHRDDANTTRDNSNTNRPTAQPDANAMNERTLAGNVVYQAIFTRANGADATAYRQMFDSSGR